MDDLAQAAFAEQAAKRSTRRRAFVAHLSVWAATNLFLVAIWAVTGAGFPWFVFPMLGWGVGLVAHAVAAFVVVPPSEALLEAERRRLNKKNAG